MPVFPALKKPGNQFFPAEVGWDFTNAVFRTTHAYGVPMLDNTTTLVALTVRVTPDVLDNGSLRIRAIAVAAAAGDFRRFGDIAWGALGEAPNEHTAGLDYATITMGDGVYTPVLDTVISPVTAGDLISIPVWRMATHTEDTIAETVQLAGFLLGND